MSKVLFCYSVYMTEMEPRQNRSAVYAGSFDPPTNGHLWVIEQGAELFDELRVAVAYNPDKPQSRFTPAERVEMLEHITEPFDNVTVDSFTTDQYTVQYARQLGSRFLLRGLRNAADYDYESSISTINRMIAPEINTVLLPGPVELLIVSSSTVKSLVGPNEWEKTVGNYVPDFVLGALKQKFEAGREA